MTIGIDTAPDSNRFCSVRCEKEYQHQKFIEEWKVGKEDGRGWCEVNIYTGNVPIQLHHKDGDYTNNDEDNLDLLCPNCHSLTPTHGGRNKGRGRSYRRAWRAKNNIQAGIVQLAERDLAKVEVPGS